MATTTVSLHGEDAQRDNPDNSTSSALADGSNLGNAVESVPVIDQGPTKPLRLTLKERLHLLAQAVGFNTTAP